MAIGSYNITTGPVAMGDCWMYSGDAEIATTATSFDMFPTGHIVQFIANDEDDAGVVQVDPNANTAGTTDSGNVTLTSNLDTAHTCRWVAWVKSL